MKEHGVSIRGFDRRH